MPFAEIDLILLVASYIIEGQLALVLSEQCSINMKELRIRSEFDSASFVNLSKEISTLGSLKAVFHLITDFFERYNFHLLLVRLSGEIPPREASAVHLEGDILISS